jgi:hypothetical protein
LSLYGPPEIDAGGSGDFDSFEVAFQPEVPA